MSATITRRRRFDRTAYPSWGAIAAAMMADNINTLLDRGMVVLGRPAGGTEFYRIDEAISIEPEGVGCLLPTGETAPIVEYQAHDKRKRVKA